MDCNISLRLLLSSGILGMLSAPIKFFLWRVLLLLCMVAFVGHNCARRRYVPSDYYAKMFNTREGRASSPTRRRLSGRVESH